MPNQQAIESAIERLSDDYLKQLSLTGWWHSIELDLGTAGGA